MDNDELQRNRQDRARRRDLATLMQRVEQDRQKPNARSAQQQSLDITDTAGTGILTVAVEGLGRRVDDGQVTQEYGWSISLNGQLVEKGDSVSGTIGVPADYVDHRRRALSTQLSFMTAAAEASAATTFGDKSENADLFGPETMELCYLFADEISMAQQELDQKIEAENVPATGSILD